MYGSFIVKGTRSSGKTVYLKSFTPGVPDVANSTAEWTTTKSSARVFESDTESDSTGLLCQTYSNGDIVAVESEKISDKMPKM